MSFRQLLTIAACLMLTLSLASGDALSAGKGTSLTDKQVKKLKEKKPRKDKRSGNQGRNRHFSRAGDGVVEIVSGQITAIKSGGIMMDGVFFSLASADLVDDYGKFFGIKDLYIGLKVSLRKEYGRVVKLTGTDFIRTGVITDRKEITRKIGSKIPTNPLRQGGAQ